MLGKFKLAPIALLLTYACGETTAFKETELGRFQISVGDDNDPSSPSADGTVSLEPINGTDPGTETATEMSKSSKVEAALAEMDDDSVGSGSGSGSGSEKGSESGSNASNAKAKQVSKNAASNTITDQSLTAADEQTKKLCSSLFEGRAKYIKLIRSTDAASSLQANSETVIAVRLSGDQAKFQLNVSGSQKLAGICVVATGNRPQTDISSTVAMGQIVYVARGNQSKALFSFLGAALDSTFVSLKGNSHNVSFSGVGEAVCSTLEAKQGQSNISCN